jgi:hypothetical protein
MIALSRLTFPAWPTKDIGQYLLSEVSVLFNLPICISEEFENWLPDFLRKDSAKRFVYPGIELIFLL